jgi:hypothetical protein
MKMADALRVNLKKKGLSPRHFDGADVPVLVGKPLTSEFKAYEKCRATAFAPCQYYFKHK